MLIDVTKFLEALEDEGADVCIDCYDYALFGFSHEAISAAINRVNQEMSAREYERILHRMEKTQPMPEELYLHGKAVNHYEIDKAISIVEQWKSEHPEGGRR